MIDDQATHGPPLNQNKSMITASSMLSPIFFECGEYLCGHLSNPFKTVS
jgi:hypothetical protein